MVIQVVYNNKLISLALKLYCSNGFPLQGKYYITEKTINNIWLALSSLGGLHCLLCLCSRNWLQLGILTGEVHG